MPAVAVDKLRVLDEVQLGGEGSGAVERGCGLVGPSALLKHILDVHLRAVGGLGPG